MEKNVRKPTFVMIVAIIFLVATSSITLAESPKEDGFYSATENAVITFSNNMILEVGNNPSSISSCTQSYTSDRLERALCIEDDTSDLFVILDRLDSNSMFPPWDPDNGLLEFFKFIKATENNGGLQVAVHPLRQNPQLSTRIVADNQNAIRVTELNDHWAEGDLLGWSNIGTPNTAGETMVWTYRIFEYICDTCKGDFTQDSPPTCSGGRWPDKCRTNDDPPLFGDDLVKAYIRYLNHHEIGHSVYFNHIYGSEYIMYPTPEVGSVQGKTVFYLPSKYSATNTVKMDLD